MFSKACEYAIRAVVYIASGTSETSKVSIDDICAHIEAPRHFTAKILQVLTRKNIVSSQKGVHGGFFINNIQRALPIKQIVTAIDGENLFTGCALGLKQCSHKKPCPMHHQFVVIRDELNRVMNETSVDMLAKRMADGSSVLKR